MCVRIEETSAVPLIRLLQIFFPIAMLLCANQTQSFTMDRE